MNYFSARMRGNTKMHFYVAADKITKVRGVVESIEGPRAVSSFVYTGGKRISVSNVPNWPTEKIMPRGYFHMNEYVLRELKKRPKQMAGLAG